MTSEASSQRRFPRRGAIVPALAAMAVLLMPAAATAQSYGRLAQVRERIAYLENDSPGSSLIYYACEAAAHGEFRRTGRGEDAIAALVACAGTGCILTGYYQNCINVATELFFLRLQREILNR